jgi:hypothetical protein
VQALIGRGSEAIHRHYVSVGFEALKKAALALADPPLTGHPTFCTKFDNRLRSMEGHAAKVNSHLVAQFLRF